MLYIIYICDKFLCSQTKCNSESAAVGKIDQMKYLRVILDQELNWKSCIK